VLAGDDARRGRTVELPVDRERDGAAGPAPVLALANAHDVRPDRGVRVEQLPLPVVLGAVAAEEDLLVEPEDDLPVEIVAVLRHRLDDPVRATDEHLLDRAPRRALPVGDLEADAR